MTAIPSGTKFIGIPSTVPTPENKSSQNNGFQEVYTIEDIIAEAQDGMATSTTTTTVNITSNQIKAMGTTPIELLPAPGANKYYDWEVQFEYTPGTTKYTCADDILIGDSVSYFGQIVSRTLIDDADLDPKVVKVSSSSGQNEIQGASYVVSYRTKLNRPLEMFTYNATDPTLGDGTLRAIITYTLRTFGA